jgi:fatty acid desaturase
VATAISTECVDVRASFLRFPTWTQHFWTWLTGKALPYQKPLLRHTWLSYLIVTLAAFFSGLSLSSMAIAFQFEWWWLALLVGWTLTLASARTMILVIAHQCIHKQFSGRPKLDLFFGELVTVLTVYQDAHAFQVEHFDGHHRHAIFATADDPPVQVLLGLGFRPGMTRRQLWWRAAIVMLSPVFYGQGFWSRLKSNLTVGTWRRLAFFVWAAFWLSVSFWVPNGIWVFAVAFALPIVPFAQLSALLDKLGEHSWMVPANPETNPRHRQAEGTWARFCGQPVPDRSMPLRQQLVAWPRWIFAMAAYHLPARLFVIVGDLPNHDYHHRFPATPEWTTAAYARQRDIDLCRPDPHPYTEVWGMFEAIDQMFEGMSRQPTAV